MDLRKYDISADKDDSIPTPDAPEGQTVANKPREFLKYAPMWAAHPDHDRVRSPCWFPVAPAACFLWAARPCKVTGSAVHLASPAAAVHITALFLVSSTSALCSCSYAELTSTRLLVLLAHIKHLRSTHSLYCCVTMLGLLLHHKTLRWHQSRGR